MPPPTSRPIIGRAPAGQGATVTRESAAAASKGTEAAIARIKYFPDNVSTMSTLGFWLL